MQSSKQLSSMAPASVPAGVFPTPSSFSLQLLPCPLISAVVLTFPFCLIIIIIYYTYCDTLSNMFMYFNQCCPHLHLLRADYLRSEAPL